MNLFDRLVDQALQAQIELAPLRAVVEKELLHHDIIREMAAAGLLTDLTFIGGTCLRACYGSSRLSEDLDFTGGGNFDRESLKNLGNILMSRLQTRYGLAVEVGEPVKETGNVATWKIKVITRPEQKSLPAQRINIDICAVPSHDRRPMLLRNAYGVDMGTGGLILQAQSREEILADKMIALALRPNRVKSRDIWDIGWLRQQDVQLPLALIPQKIEDRHFTPVEFLRQLDGRERQILDDPGLRGDFLMEMKRFLPPKVVADTVAHELFWHYLTDLVAGECAKLKKILTGEATQVSFKM